MVNLQEAARWYAIAAEEGNATEGQKKEAEAWNKRLEELMEKHHAQQPAAQTSPRAAE